MNGDNIFKRKTKVIDDEEGEGDNHIERGEDKPIKSPEKKAHTNGSSSIKVTSIPTEKKVDSSPSKQSNPKAAKEVSIEDKINLLKNKNKSELKNVVGLSQVAGIKRPDITNRDKGSSSAANNQRSQPVMRKEEKKVILNQKRKRDEESDDSDDSEFRSGQSEDRSYSSSGKSGSESSSESSSSEESIQIKRKEVKNNSRREKEETPIKKKHTSQSSNNKNKIVSKTPERTERIDTTKKKVTSTSISSGKVLKTKGSLANQLLKRWWYALPKWPADDYDPSEKLNSLKLRQVEKNEWKLEPNINDKGFTKCIEPDGFKFVYIDPSGKVHDLRPTETMPCYNNLISKPERELYQLLITAINNQINELHNGEKYCNEDYKIIENLREELENAESNFARLR